jgi:hypothetical protein
MCRVSEAVRTTHGHDGTIVLDIQRGRILRLNLSASEIFGRLQQGQNESQIIDGMSRTFHMSPEIIQKDLSDFLKSLEQCGLICSNTSEKHP